MKTKHFVCAIRQNGTLAIIRKTGNTPATTHTYKREYKISDTVGWRAMQNILSTMNTRGPYAEDAVFYWRPNNGTGKTMAA